MDLFVEKLLWASESLPVVLAIGSILFISAKFNSLKSQFKLVAVLFAIALVVLILAQTSWAISFLIYHDLIGTWWSNRIWTVFNTLVVVVSILYVRQSVKMSKLF